MANAQKYTKSACGHMTAHYERAKDENGEYIKFGNQNIDPSRTHLNYNLAPLRVSDGVSGGSGQIDFIRQRTTEARTLNRADVNVMVSWVVTLPKYQKIVTDPNIAHVSFDKDMAESVKRTALAVDSISAERDQALARAERADLRATQAEAKVERAYADANRQLQAKIAEVEQDRPSLKMTQENIQLRKENQSLKTENSTLQGKVADLEGMVRRLLQIVREKLPEVYAALTQRKQTEKQQPTQEKPKPKSKGWER